MDSSSFLMQWWIRRSLLQALATVQNCAASAEQSWLAQPRSIKRLNWNKNSNANLRRKNWPNCSKFQAKKSKRRWGLLHATYLWMRLSWKGRPTRCSMCLKTLARRTPTSHWGTMAIAAPEIERSLSTLTDRQCDVLKLYFGIGVRHRCRSSLWRQIWADPRARSPD